MNDPHASKVLQRNQGLLSDYFDLLLKWNKAYNLVSSASPEILWDRHIEDSLSVLPFVDVSSLLDLGAGAGFPGIVLAIKRPEMQVTLVDSNIKKTRFMDHVRMTLKLSNVTVKKARIEALETDHLFDASICRAFTALGRYVDMAAPLVAANGPLWAMKGPAYKEELAELPEGFECDSVQVLNVPGLDAERYLVDIRRP